LSTPGHNTGGIAAERLRSFIERIERLTEEKDAIAGDIKEVFSEAKSSGFETKVMRAIIRLRKMDEAERQEMDALTDLYLAALGMLGGDPLGSAAVKRLSPKPAEPKDEDPKPDDEGVAEDGLPEPVAKVEVTADQAREMGADAARAGKPVTSNPFPARDPNRAAFDEGWCQSSGSDGMDIPEAWKRTPKKKPADNDDSNAAGEAA
jgi:uncharacterized protein (UPF0335 family)